jgi:hypothetical protein
MTLLMIAAIIALLAVNFRQWMNDPSYTDDLMDISDDVTEVE